MVVDGGRYLQVARLACVPDIERNRHRGHAIRDFFLSRANVAFLQGQFDVNPIDPEDLRIGGWRRKLCGCRPLLLTGA